jgi:hypothetical protein
MRFGTSSLPLGTAGRFAVPGGIDGGRHVFFQRLALSSRSVKTRPFLNALCLAGVERDGIGQGEEDTGTNSLFFVPNRFCASTRRVHIIRSVSVKKADNTVA